MPSSLPLCLPLVVILVGFYFQNTGIRDLRSDMNMHFSRFDQKFDDLTSKVVDIDNRLIRVEERLKL
ncbi:MAG TPA: hypothetical protein VKG65_08585 [Terriglobales bacterium]|nr:hypothetical protein [Terriglobales bacterium]